MNNLRTRLEAAGKRGAEEWAAIGVTPKAADEVSEPARVREAHRAGHASLIPLVERLHAALSKFNPLTMRDQQEYLARAEALRELEAYLLKGEGK
jgi:hypothetical protein